MKFKKTFHVRLTEEQDKILVRVAEESGVTKADLLRKVLEAIAGDYLVVPVTPKEKEFIEGVCDSVGVEPADAVKIILLSYQTLMSSPLWKIVRPVDELLDEMRTEEDERERAGQSSGQG